MYSYVYLYALAVCLVNIICHFAFTKCICHPECSKVSPKAKHCKIICLTFLIMGFFVSANCLTLREGRMTIQPHCHLDRSMQRMRICHFERSREISSSCHPVFFTCHPERSEGSPYGEAPLCHFAFTKCEVEKSLIIIITFLVVGFFDSVPIALRSE